MCIRDRLQTVKKQSGFFGPPCISDASGPVAVSSVNQKDSYIYLYYQAVPNTEWPAAACARDRWLRGNILRKGRFLRQEWKTPWEISTTGRGSESDSSNSSTVQALQTFMNCYGTFIHLMHKKYTLATAVRSVYIYIIHGTFLLARTIHDRKRTTTRLTPYSS